MFKPLNRHVLLEKVEVEDPQEDSLVLVPEDYRLEKQSLHGLYKILAHAHDCEKINETLINYHIIVDERMVQKISLGKESYYLVLENYIYGSY